MPFSTEGWKSACEDLHAVCAELAAYYRAAESADAQAAGATPPAVRRYHETLAFCWAGLASALARLAQ